MHVAARSEAKVRCCWNGPSKMAAKHQAVPTATGTASIRVVQNVGMPDGTCGATSLRLIIATIGRWIR
jgi:hypothetical protein